MMKIKEQYRDKVVGFNKLTASLGERKDLEKLADIALRSNDKSLLELFEELPTLEKLNEKKGKKLIEDVKKNK